MEPWQPTLSKGSQSLLRRHRRLVAVGVAALILALPVAVSASHQFSDVPTSSTYHTSVSRLVGAGLTGGCGGGKYCPNDPVTRGQMAAFLNRGLGRGMQDAGVTEDDHWATFLPDGSGFIAVNFMTIGGAAGGTQHVLATGTLAPFTDEAGVCPCEVAMILLSEVGEASPQSFTVFGADASPYDSQYKGSVSMSYLFTVPSGTEVGFAIIAQIVPTTAPSPAQVADTYASLQAITVPFALDGSNPAPPITSTGRPKLPFGTWPFGDHKMN
jgi:S-layer family protein